VLKSTPYQENYNGVVGRSDYTTTRTDIFTNKWLNITIIVNLCFLLLNLIEPEFPIILNLITTGIALVFYLLYNTIYRGNLNFYLYLYYILWVSSYGLLSSYSTGILIYFIMLFALSIILFEEDKIRYKMLLLTAVFFVIVLCLKNIVEPLVSYENPFRSVIHLLLSMVVVFYAIRSYTTVTESESRTKDLLLDKIKEQNLELERFAYITSHDLKQPVRNICNFSSLLERNLKSTNDTTKSIEYLNIIKTSSRNIEKLIDDILKYSRIDQVNDNLEVIDLNDILKTQEENLRYILDAKNASITYDKLPKMKGNNVYLSLLLQNLIENGIKYNRSDKPEVNVSVEEGITSLRITVTDNGIGIDQSYFEEIFQPFKRLHSNREFEGSGLGLSICNRIVEKHSGQLLVNSATDVGTTFNIVLPEQYLYKSDA